jgi:hypothetical protein
MSKAKCPFPHFQWEARKVLKKGKTSSLKKKKIKE